MVLKLSISSRSNVGRFSFTSCTSISAGALVALSGEFTVAFIFGCFCFGCIAFIRESNISLHLLSGHFVKYSFTVASLL